MGDIVYCPKCGGKEHKKDVNAFVRTHWTVDAVRIFREFFAVHLFGMIWVKRSADVREEEFTPERFCCQNCGHQFLSSETYGEEIRWAKRFRRWGAIVGLICLLPVALIVASICIDDPAMELGGSLVGSICGLVILLAVIAICLSCVLHASKSCKELTAQWKQLQNMQAKQMAAHTEGTAEKIPAWKRVQMEQKSR